MKLLCVADWRDRTTLSEVGGRFLEGGDLQPPAGLTLIGRWHDISAKKSWLVVDVSDGVAFETWMAKWSDHIDISVYPVLDDDECGVVLSRVLCRG